LDKIEEDGFILEEDPIETAEISPVGEELADVDSTNSGISIKEHGVNLQEPSMDKKKVMREPLMKKQQGEPEIKTTPIRSKMEFKQKNVERYVSDFPVGPAEGESDASKRGLVVTIILFVVTLLALILVYFILSSDIQENRDRIDILEKQIGVKIIMENSPTNKNFST